MIAGVSDLAVLRRALLALSLCVVIVPSGADAASRVCRQLESQLASLPRGGGSGSAARYDTAITRQKEQMQRVRQQSRRAGCGMAILRSSVSACAELNATAARMEKNLLDLQRKRARIGGGDTRRERARINAALTVNGCRGSDRGNGETEVRTRTTIDGRGTLRIGALKGTFRTLCVRTCDGYFFPISYSVSSAAFERDEMACRAACPGTRVELYHHRVPGEESDQMISASTGLPYSELPAAFAYKSGSADTAPACGCQPASASGERGFQTIGGDYSAQTGADDTATAAIPRPSDRPDPLEDPETLMTREGGLDAAGLERIARKPEPRAAPDDGERHVRVVGPTFLPDPEEAIDLRAPDQPRAP